MCCGYFRQSLRRQARWFVGCRKDWRVRESTHAPCIDQPGPFPVAAPALPSKKVEFDPIVSGICFDYQDRLWRRSVHDLDPEAPLRSTNQAVQTRESKLTDKVKKSRSFKVPQKSLAFALSRALRLSRTANPETPARDVMFWTDDKCVCSRHMFL